LASVSCNQQNQDDEAYKASNSRHCPNCDRVIQKMEATDCDVMICGRNFHTERDGVNQQHGCGARINWREARPYQPDVGRRLEVSLFEQAAPERAAQHRHMAGPDVPIQCDVCNEAIVGPRAECVHCPSHDRCIRCHLEPHPQNHVFRLHMGGDA
jgi:hypothetical protein